MASEGPPTCYHDGSLGHFAKHLMSTIVTLFVGEGPAKVQYHAHEDVLCQVPFFTAALTGNFREASEKLIHMPDDQPKLVAKMIEFLYKGTYTNPEFSNASSTPESDPTASSGATSNDGTPDSSPLGLMPLSSLPKTDSLSLPTVPALTYPPPLLVLPPTGNPILDNHRSKVALNGSLSHKIFHAELFVLADKYGIKPLMKTCIHRINGHALPDTDELLIYWGVIYEITGPASQLRIINRVSSLGVRETRDWVRILWQEWPKEFGAAVEQYPEFARDMMVLLASPE